MGPNRPKLRTTLGRISFFHSIPLFFPPSQVKPAWARFHPRGALRGFQQICIQTNAEPPPGPKIELLNQWPLQLTNVSFLCRICFQCICANHSHKVVFLLPRIFRIWIHPVNGFNCQSCLRYGPRRANCFMLFSQFVVRCP